MNLVNHEQAAKLKQIGFDSHCESSWNFDGMDWRFQEKEVDGAIVKGSMFPTPTVELALKWLRHKHKIHVGSSRHNFCNFVEVIDDINETRISMAEGIKFINREDADMHGLDLAINYIQEKSKISLM